MPAQRLPRAAALALAAAVLAPAAGRAQSMETFTGPCEHGGRMGTRIAVAGVFVGGNVALYEYFRRAWWSGERGDFTVNHDWGMEFRDQDKLGHALGGYHLTRISSGLLRAACVGERKAVWWGATYAALFQLQIEIWDGTQEKYGFSPPDLLFNTAGAAYAVAQHEVPALRPFKPTISYERTLALKRSPPESELRETVDYSGQTYWVSVNPDDLLGPDRQRWWPGILRLSVGRSITDWVNPETLRTQRAANLLILSIDVDPERLPGNHPVWRTIKHQLSYYRFPAPAIVIGPGGGATSWYR